MAKHRRIPGEQPQARDAVLDNLGGAYWSVDEGQWSTVRPGLPADLVDLVAPPIVVGIAPVPVLSRAVAEPPVPPGVAGDVESFAVLEPTAARPEAAEDAPLRVAGPPPAPRTGGRHRRPAPTS